MRITPATSQEAAEAILLDVRPPQGRWRELDYLRSVPAYSFNEICTLQG